MPAFVSLFGAATLAVQEKLSRNVDASVDPPSVPNVVIVELDRERFRRENPAPALDEIERFRKGLQHEIDVFLEANNWKIGGSGRMMLHILLREVAEGCTVRVQRRDMFYTLTLRDDRGERSVDVKNDPVILGRSSDRHPRNFIPLDDASRSWSREHLMLTLRDLVLYCRLLGKNATTLNGEPFPEEEQPVRAGDVIRCGPQAVIVGELCA